MRRVRFKVLFTTGDAQSLDEGGGVVYLATDTGKDPGSPDRQWICFEWWYSEDYYETGKYNVYRLDVRPDMLKELDWLKPHIQRCAPADCPRWEPGDEPTKQRGEWLWRQWRGSPGAWRISNHLRDVARTLGSEITAWDLAHAAKSPELRERVWFIEMVLQNFGPQELDSYPVEFTRRDLRRRWRGHVDGHWTRQKEAATK